MRGIFARNKETEHVSAMPAVKKYRGFENIRTESEEKQCRRNGRRCPQKYIFIVGRAVLNGIMTPGELMQFITYSGMLYGYVDQLSNLPRRLMDLVTSMERISDIMNQEPDIQDGEKPVELEIQGEIEFQHASFGYKSYLPVLEDVSLKVAKGEMINLIQKALGRLTEGRTTFAIACLH